MQNASRDSWLGTLEIISVRKPDQAEAEWAWVMKELGLGPDYFLAVYEAVRQGRWRESENPGGYLKSVAMREQRNAGRNGIPGERKGPRGIRGMQGLDWREAGEEITIGRAVGWAPGRGIDSEDGETVSREEMLDNLEYAADSGRSVKGRDGTWRTQAGWGNDHEGLLRPERTRIRRGMDVSAVREAHLEEDGPIPDFQAWAERAGLNEWEKKVAGYKMAGIAREKAIAEQPDEESRKALQAAWKKMDRTGLERLREKKLVTDERG